MDSIPVADSGTLRRARDLSLEEGDLVGGKYRIRGIIGRGGMGMVLEAFDEHLGRPVALKTLTPQGLDGSRTVDQCLAEGRHLASIDSPHVVRVLDAGVEELPGAGHLPFLVLERLEGEDLWSFMQRRPLSRDTIVDVALQLCDALSGLHAAGIIHNDVKPENVFVCGERDGVPHVKLIDLGIASRIGEKAEPVLRRAGSPGYAAPERLCEGRGEADVRSDIWSLGVVLYELLTLRHPFPGETPLELYAQVLNAPVPPVSAVCSDLSPDLGNAVDRCLRRDPEDRFASVADLALALSPHAGVKQRAEGVARRIEARLEGVHEPFPLVRMRPLAVELLTDDLAARLSRLPLATSAPRTHMAVGASC